MINPDQAIIPGFEPTIPEAPPPPAKPPPAALPETPITKPGPTQDDVRRVSSDPAIIPCSEPPEPEPPMLPAKPPPAALAVTLLNKAGLNQGDVNRVGTALGTAQAKNTQRVYRGSLSSFRRWCEGRGVAHLPADTDHVVAYLAEAAEELKMATVKVHRSAIADAHRRQGFEDPTAAPIVHDLLNGLSKQYRYTQAQARGITQADLVRVRATACQRRKAGGHSYTLETNRRALARGLQDIALCSMMRDGLLRRAEVIELRWSDLELLLDGTARLLIRFSKTDQEGEGATVYLGKDATRDIEAIRPPNAGPGDRIFGVSCNAIYSRIRKACQQAGLGDGYSGHSGRVGMAQDLSAAGYSFPEIMTAGRWKSPTMVAKYCRNQELSRGAVAEFHKGKHHPDPAGS